MVRTEGEHRLEFTAGTAFWLTDLPWQGLSVMFIWRVRKCLCSNDACQQKIFVERLHFFDFRSEIDKLERFESVFVSS